MSGAASPVGSSARTAGPGCPTEAVEAWPTPTPAGLARPFATGAYDGTLRAMVVGHKERRLLGLTRPLGELLATSVLAAAGPTAPLLLVPCRRGPRRSGPADTTRPSR